MDHRPNDGEQLGKLATAEENWIGRWMRPRGPQAAVAGVAIFALIVAVSALVYETGGTGYAWLHLMYLPIIMAAASFGVSGGVVAALVAGLAIGPYMPMNAFTGLPQATSNWMFRIGFFVLVGGFSGLISNFLHGQIDRLQKAHRDLLQTHEELKSAQMKLIQTAKLESIGRLAAGVAHEVKNPLAVIQLGVDYLAGAVEGSANRDSAETIQDMADAVKRADTVIKGLLNFSRSEPLTLVAMDVNAVLEESLLLVKHELSKAHVTLEKSLAAGLPRVELDSGKVKQVFINVFMNAVQAMGESGTLSVRTLLEKDVVVVEIEDTGAGIAEDKLDRMFEPFFTTKDVGSGTGLGLSVSRNIIEMHRGTIRIANRRGSRGAAVTITFPVPTRS